MGTVSRPPGSTPSHGRGCPGPHHGLHHMRDWPLLWREALGYCDRVCRHGLGHPDPDDVVRGQSTGGVSTSHQCDGCCIAPLRAVADEHDFQG